MGRDVLTCFLSYKDTPGSIHLFFCLAQKWKQACKSRTIKWRWCSKEHNSYTGYLSILVSMWEWSLQWFAYMSRRNKMHVTVHGYWTTFYVLICNFQPCNINEPKERIEVGKKIQQFTVNAKTVPGLLIPWTLNYSSYFHQSAADADIHCDQLAWGRHIAFINRIPQAVIIGARRVEQMKEQVI